MNMKNLTYLLALLLTVSLTAQEKYTTRTGSARIFSTTPAEDITANNYSVTSTIEPSTGEMVFLVPVQSFEFDKSLMQKHFNQPKFMDSKAYPRITFRGKIQNPEDVKWDTNGTYEVKVKGDLTIRDVTKTITEKGAIEVKDGEIIANSVFVVKQIGDYNVGKPSGSKRNNVADDIEVSFQGIYKKE
jgi:polyisoprenoid-binding protein YceI